MIKAGDIVSYTEMCNELAVNLQRGMNFRLRRGESVILMSLRPNAPYADRVEQGGKIIVYEGHDIARIKGAPNPKTIDQPEVHTGGRPTQNGLFIDAVRRFKAGKASAEKVRVYEKIRPGIWVYNGLFRLVDGWTETVENRQVFKFKLELSSGPVEASAYEGEPDHDRVIPSAVKLEVWKRDKGKCRKCGSTKNLHFDHVIPYSHGGSSKNSNNIQILCLRHNIEKRDKIE
jgi:hypothetical protein